MSDIKNQLNPTSAKWEPINFVFYLSFAKWPILLAIFAELAIRILSDRFLGEMLLGARLDLAMWLVRLIALIYIGYLIFKNYGEAPSMGAFAGVMSGAAIGLGAALSRFAEGFKVWKIFNVVTETVIVAIVGCLAVFLVVYIWESIPFLNKK